MLFKRVEKSCMKSDKGPQVFPLKSFDIVDCLWWGVFLLVDECSSCLQEGGIFGLIYVLSFTKHTSK